MMGESPFATLRQEWCCECSATSQAPPEVWFCHRTIPEEHVFSWLSGLKELCRRLAVRHFNGEALPPVLLAAEHALPALREWATASGAGLEELLDWPGMVYLPFGADRVQVGKAWQRANAGTTVPIPKAALRGAWAPIDDAVAASQQVRHWLQNRLKSARTSAANLYSSAEVHPSYLKAQEAVSPQHRDMVGRLCGLAQSPGFPAASRRALLNFREALQRFERVWAELEERRAELLAVPIAAPGPGSAPTFANAMNSVASEIEQLIEATAILEATFPLASTISDTTA